MEEIFITPGLKLISQERELQIVKHGFTGEHHADHPEWYDAGQLQYAAMALLSMDGKPENLLTATPLNWDVVWFNNLCRRSNQERIIIAGALLAAELDRRKAIIQKAVNLKSELQALKKEKTPSSHIRNVLESLKMIASTGFTSHIIGKGGYDQETIEYLCDKGLSVEVFSDFRDGDYIKVSW